jgi:1-phosphofructokinase
VGAVLATLGAKGAVLVTADGAWLATHAPIRAVSTVGAGDSSLAGYLLADISGADAEGRLRQAVAHGAAAASLPGSTVPAVNQTHPSAVTVTALTKD